MVKQLVQSADGGEARVVDVPPPSLLPGTVIVETAASVISTGTERAAIEFARKNVLGKAAARPDLVRQLLRKVQSEGVLRTYELARSRLDAPLTPGYSSAGTILASHADVAGVPAGALVACAGAGYASHAEIVRVPRNLVAVVPDGVSAEQAAFSTIGAIALHGFRLAEPTLGETVVVSGLGLIGLLAVQIARAGGCRVIGVDPDASRARLAETLGAERAVSPGDAPRAVADATEGAGADVVLIAAATSSNDPIDRAAEVCRDRGRIVLVGAVGLELDRRPFFAKELSFRVSRSYGPGRYDPAYEEGGEDYPLGYVRWTENRNMKAFLELLRAGSVAVEPLITRRCGIADAVDAYEAIGSGPEAPLAIVITYPGAAGGEAAPPSDAAPAARARTEDGGAPPAEAPGAGGSEARVGVGFLGAGAFATGTLLPAMGRVEGLRLVGVVASTGVSANATAERFGFDYPATDAGRLLGDPTVDVVAIATRHDLHAAQTAEALAAGKHVFCEKPLALDEAGLQTVEVAARAASDRLLFVGYNRRYAPLAAELERFFSRAPEGGSLVMQIRVNAGAVPPTHWVHDLDVGGGRIIGEVCHFVDLMAFLCGSDPVEAFAYAAGGRADAAADDLVASLRYRDGSVGTVAYSAAGDRRMPKERIEVIGRGRSAVLDDFRRLECYADGARKVTRSRWRQDKGHSGEWRAFLDMLRRHRAPPSLDSYLATSRATFAIVRSLAEGGPVAVAPAAPAASSSQAAQSWDG
ncbi:MAG TPA: bi-domain-containing oxidoreductase [Longimicrobiales bacterium]|nr:bi-domain-containing oxidoreductase [Longimicrobiales bacterium]